MRGRDAGSTGRAMDCEQKHGEFKSIIMHKNYIRIHRETL